MFFRDVSEYGWCCKAQGFTRQVKVFFEGRNSGLLLKTAYPSGDVPSGTIVSIISYSIIVLYVNVSLFIAYICTKS